MMKPWLGLLFVTLALVASVIMAIAASISVALTASVTVAIAASVIVRKKIKQKKPH